MADSAQDRNLPASERRRSRAREDGQLPRSRDLGHFTALAMGGTMLLFGAAPLASWLRDLLASGLRFNHATVVNPAAMSEQLQSLGIKALLVIVPMGLVMIAVGLLTAMLSGGWDLSFKAVAPNFGRFNPIAGIGRMFAKDHLIDVLKMVALGSVIGTIGAFYLKAKFMAMASLLLMPLPEAIATLASTVAGGFGMLLLLLGGWALVDVPLQRQLWLHRL